MSVAPTLRRGYGPSGTRRYGLPLWLWRGLTMSLISGTRRSMASDAAGVLAGWATPPVVLGGEHIPDSGPLVLLANHYQRRGLWIGFAGGILAREIMLRRRDHFSLHYTVIGDMRVNGRVVPGTREVFRRIARCWDMVTLPTGPDDVEQRAVAVRRLLGIALPPPRGRGEPIGIFPEGTLGSTRGLREALPGTGSLLVLLSRAGVPLLPAAVWESGARLHARFGPTFALQPRGELRGNARDGWARTRAMRHIAALLPARLHGVHAGPFAEPLMAGVGQHEWEARG